MNNIVIHNYLAGTLLLEREPTTWDAIVILDSRSKATDFVAQHAKRHIYLRFDDVLKKSDGKRIPSIDDIHKALEFAKSSQNLLVCCRAGQSRSAAIAFLICLDRIGTEAASQILNPERHSPNLLVIELGSRLLGDKPVMPTLENWNRTHGQVKLSDHLDQIEQEFNELERQGARNRIEEHESHPQ